MIAELPDTKHLIGKEVRVNIKVKSSYTSDLYNAIQGKTAVVLRRQGELSSYDNAYLLEFGLDTTKEYAGTHSGQLSATDPTSKMAWWTERKNFTVKK